MTMNNLLTCEAPNTTIAEFANTVEPDETAHNAVYIEILRTLFCCLPFLALYRLTNTQTHINAKYSGIKMVFLSNERRTSQVNYL